MRIYRSTPVLLGSSGWLAAQAAARRLLLRVFAAFVGLLTATLVSAPLAHAGPLPPATLAPSATGPGEPAVALAPSSASPIAAAPSAPDALDRQTPRRTIAGFLKETKGVRYAVAALYLDLRDLSEAQQKKDGPELAQKLGYAVAHRRTFDMARIPDEPDGDPAAKPPGRFVVDSFFVGEDPVSIAVERVRFPDGVERWLIARATVAQIPVIDAAYGPRPVGVPIPSSLTHPQIFGNEPWQWIGIALALVLAYAVARGGAAISVRVASLFARATPTKADDLLVESARRPLRLLLLSVMFRGLVSPLQLTTAVLTVCEHAAFTAFIVAVTWFLIRVLRVGAFWLDERAGRDGGDVLMGRRVRTQAVLLERLASITLSVLAAAVLLMQFDLVRSFGYSLLASAGLASVALGLAAQKSLGAIIGGIQFSAAQPVRMGDQVVVEGEFGELEEINLTYAVVRTWDKRRLVLPITYFLEKPFQNWTRSSTELLGTVFLRADFTVPVDRVRAELQRLLAGDPLWDKVASGLQVTDVDGGSLTLRALVSAEDAGKLWDLRCNIREKLLTFLQQLEGGKYLPVTRQLVEGLAAATPPIEAHAKPSADPS